jgi:hypothetical protein
MLKLFGRWLFFVFVLGTWYVPFSFVPQTRKITEKEHDGPQQFAQNKCQDVPSVPPSRSILV